MMLLITIKTELKHSIDTMFTDSDANQDIKYNTYIACLKIGKFRGKSPVDVAKNLSEEETLQLLGEAKGTRYSGNRVNGPHPEYSRLIAGEKPWLTKRNKGRSIKWILICTILLQMERLRPERR